MWFLPRESQLIPPNSAKLHLGLNPNLSMMCNNSLDLLYRRFIKDFAMIARPLHHLTEKTVTFNWTVECTRSFQKLHLKLVSPPVLAFPDHSRGYFGYRCK